MKDIRLKDFPTFIRSTNPDEFMFNFMVDSVNASNHKASAILLNTFESLEQQVLNSLHSMQQLPPIYSIGPFELLTHQIIPKYNNSNNLITSINSSLWKEESGWKEWLDSKEPQSVVYVNFGSITTLTQEQFMEFACGLANSKKHFLWVIRPDLVKNSKYDAPILPQEFVIETKERGMLVSWCS
ncbi:7-deoxyloganetin glucosyltransferase [Bienertia sinuspersici]